MRLLNGLRIRPKLIEVHELAMIFCFVFGPDLFHREHSLAKHSPSLLVIGSVVLHLLGVPSTANAKDKPSTGKKINARDFFRCSDWVSLDDQTNACRNAKLGRSHRSGGQSHKRIVSMPILLR